MPSNDEEFTEIASIKKSPSMPRLTRDRYKTNKIYRVPPTPPLEKQIDLERSFKLDCIAVSNISLDYTRANPKLGSVIPPYNSLEDKTISETVKNNGVREFLRRTGQTEAEHDSMAGKVHDFFFKHGTGFRYLSKRNLFGNGHHTEMADGHQRYMAEQPRVMISYNNMNGYRRNIPKLRTEPPSTFSVDPTYYNHLLKTYGSHYSDEELLEHFKNTYMIGYPFYDNNYNNFHPTVKYIITVKTGNASMEKFEGNLGINIVSRNFDTGFIKLDDNISVKQRSKNENGEDPKRNLFLRNHKDVFQFEDQDIRTISAIILSRDGKGDELLYLDYIEVEIQKTYDKQTYRFPFDGWVRMSKQEKKAEQLKARFGKRNSIVVYPNEKPKYEYKIKVCPQFSKDTEYSIRINYDLKNQENIVDYKFEFFSELPKTGNLLIGLTGSVGQSEIFKFSDDTIPVDDENKMSFQVKGKEIGEITQVSLMYDDSQSKNFEFNLRNFQITDSEGQVYEVYLDQNLKISREKIIKTKIIAYASKSSETFTKTDGRLMIKISNQTEATSSFILREPNEIIDGVALFIKKEKNLRNIEKVSIKIEGEGKYFASIKSIEITGSKGQVFKSQKNIIIKNNKEITFRDESKTQSNLNVDNKSKGEVCVQIIGDKKKTDLFPLKNPVSDDENLDKFSKVDFDIGKIKNVLVKYQDKSENKIEMNFIEIIDPRGNSYKFKTEMTLSGGEEVMLPRVVNSEELLMKENSNVEETEDKKSKKIELKEIKSEYETKGKKEVKKKELKHKKEAKPAIAKESTQVELKRESTKVEFKKEPTKIEIKKEPTQVELKREPTKVEIQNEPTQVELKREPTKVEIQKEPTQVELKRESSPTLEKTLTEMTMKSKELSLLSPKEASVISGKKSSSGLSAASSARKSFREKSAASAATKKSTSNVSKHEGDE